MSALAISAIGSLIPFGLQNLAIMMSVLRPGSQLAVVQGDIVSVKLDRSVVSILQASQKLLVSEGRYRKLNVENHFNFISGVGRMNEGSFSA